MEKLKSALLPYVQEEKVSQFVEKLVDLIPVCSYKEEHTIYSTLLKHNLFDKAEKMATNYYPSFLAFDLSEDSLKTVMSKYSMNEKALLVESFDNEDHKETLVNAFAPEGSTAREMFELEVEQFGIDLNAKRKLEETKDQNVTDFYKRVKTIVNKDGSVKADAQNVIADWVEGNMSNAQESEFAA